MAYEYEWSIRAEDVDYSGCIFTPRLFNCLLRGISDIYAEIGFPSKQAHEEDFSRPVVNVGADIHTPMCLDDVVDVTMWTVAGDTSVKFTATGRVGNEPAFDASVTTVIVDDTTGEPTRIPAHLHDGLREYERTTNG